MGQHLRRSGWFFGMGTATPFLMAFVSAWLAGIGFFLFLFLFGSPALIGVFVIGGIVLIVHGVRAARQAKFARDRAVAALVAPVLMGLTLALAWPSLAAGSYSGTWTRLMANRSHYETIISNVKLGHPSRNPNSSFEQDGGVEYVVDAGPPVRVAFNPEGMFDNWSGIVFDPTGEVMLGRGFDPVTGKFAAPDQIAKLFGGDLVACRHLWWDYYHCSFT